MKRLIGIVATLSALALAAAPALAQDPATPQPSQQQSTPQATPPATAPDATPAPAVQPAPAAQPAMGNDAATPNADPLVAIRDVGKKADPKADQKMTAALESVNSDVEKNATTDGDRKIAERLAGEFGSTPDALIAEKGDLKASWGQLMIAHSLIANDGNNLTAKQLFDLRAEGMSWGQIATGMGFRLGDVIRAAKEEAKVAKGLEKPDGKVAVVHRGNPAAAKAEAKGLAKTESKSSATPAAAPDAGASGGGSDKK
ncbi:MAG: hypothetical protein ACM3PF_13385 [Bacteroidota bacterium]